MEIHAPENGRMVYMREGSLRAAAATRYSRTSTVKSTTPEQQIHMHCDKSLVFPPRSGLF